MTDVIAEHIKPATLGKPVVFTPEGDCDAVVIWLHGFGDAPENWAKTLKPLRTWKTASQWMWVHLHAPLVPQPCYDGVALPAWAQLVTGTTACLHVADLDKEDPKGSAFLAESVAAVEQEIERLLTNGVLPGRILIGGFAQGAATALQIALSFGKPLAGCVLVSGWLPASCRAVLRSDKLPDTPILLCHGVEDEIVGFDCALNAKTALEEAGAKLCFQQYKGLGHNICQAELAAIATFLNKSLVGRDEVPVINWNTPDSDSDCVDDSPCNLAEGSETDRDETESTYVGKEALATLKQQVESGHTLCLQDLHSLSAVGDLKDDMILVPVRVGFVEEVMNSLDDLDLEGAGHTFLRGASIALEMADSDTEMTARDWRTYLADHACMTQDEEEESSATDKDMDSDMASSSDNEIRTQTDDQPPEKRVKTCD